GRPPHGDRPPHGEKPTHELEFGSQNDISFPPPQRQSTPVMPTVGRGPKGGGGRRGMREKEKPKNTKESFFRLWSYLGNHKLLLITALFFVLVNAIFSSLASYQIRPITNGLVEQAGTTALFQSLMLMLGIYIVAVVSQYIQQRIMLEIAQSSLSKLRSDLYIAMEKLPLRFYDQNRNGDLMSKFTNDVDVVNQMLSSTCVSLVSGIVTLTMTISIMLYTNWKLALVTMAIAPIFTKLSREISKRSMKYYKNQQASIGNLNGFIEERITGQKVVKVFNQEEETMKAFDEYNRIQRDNSFKAQFLSGIMGPTMGLLAQMSYVITSCVGALMCVSGDFDLGGFIIFLGYSKSFSRPVNDIFMQINTIFSALAGAERVFGVIDEKPEKQDTPDATTLSSISGEVIFKNVKFGYLPHTTILHDLSLTAKSNQKIAFVGSTGAGKTTITNVLNRFYEIEDGTITLDGVDIRNLKKDFLRENIAMVLQDTHLFTGTIRENIRYGRLDATDEEVVEASKTANAHSFITKLEKGYDTKLSGDGSSLSGGQRQLLNIARAAISNAPILVLDEATSSVDTRTERLIEIGLERLMSSRTTFVIAHRLSTVRNSDMIIVLDQGRILEQGNHTELMEKKGKYYSLCTGTAKLE
ncbi:MAG: ABC transporter ATP-binding protein, partial [Clostridia bacterium]